MNSQGHIYIGFDHGGFLTPPWGIHVSTDNGNNWTYLGLFYEQILTVVVNSQDDIYVGTALGVYRSTDDGINWVPVNNGLNHHWVNHLVVDSEDNLFAATSGGGVYWSQNNGNSWNQINSGLSYSTVFSLTIDGDGYIFAGTDNGGVFRSSNTITSIDQTEHNVPSDYVLEQNYPNPFNSQTFINFFSPRKEKIIIEVFNVIGSKVKTLFNGEVTPGEHQIAFEAEDLPSGVYIYRLKTLKFSLTKKMVLLE